MRIATFNLENLDEKSSQYSPSLDLRISVLQPQITRLNADIICFQEVNGQERTGKKRDILALKKLLKDTPYRKYNLAVTRTSAKEVYNERNLVIASRYEIAESRQIRNDYVDNMMYRRVTAKPAESEAKEFSWERPLLYAKLVTPHGVLHVINVHFKSRIPSGIPGQQKSFGFHTVSGWAEGYFMSSIKRVGQALETRLLVDEVFDQQEDANIIVCGDFNSEPLQVPVEAIAGRVENTANSALVGRQLIAASDSVAVDKRYSHLHEGKGHLLDHLLFSRAMLGRYKSAEIHNELLHDESISYASDRKFPESDHAPFVAEFSD